MFQIGDQVVYSVHGVCRVVELEERIVERKTVSYLVLEPVGQGGAKYLVPTSNAAAMTKLKRILTREELEALLCSEEVHTDGWIKDENLRKQTYRELIRSADRGKLLCMVRTLYRHKAAQTAMGRKCHMCDDNFLRDAEKLLVSEVSVIMDITMEQAKTYLNDRLNQE